MKKEHQIITVPDLEHPTRLPWGHTQSAWSKLLKPKSKREPISPGARTLGAMLELFAAGLVLWGVTQGIR